MTKVFCIGFAAAMIFSISAFADTVNTVGELLDKGGKKLNKEETASAYPVTVSQKWPNGGGEMELTYKTDGTVTGSGRHYQSNTTSGFSGTWSVDDRGEQCVKGRWTDWNDSMKFCAFHYALGEVIYASKDDDREAAVRKSNYQLKK